MKCIVHTEIDAVSNCIRCGSGICQECVISTYYQIDNKPLCKKCNYEVGCENDQIFKSFLKSKYIKMGIFVATFLFGLIVFIVNKSKGAGTGSAVFLMLLIWGLGFIGNFFDKKQDTRSVKAQAKDALLEIKYPVSTLVGKVLGFFIMALTSPFQIAALFIGINKVKKQITDNNAIMNQFISDNNI